MIKQRSVTYKTEGASLDYTQMGDVVVNSASDVTITLPTPHTGLWYRVSNVGSGVATIYYGTTITTLKKAEQALLLSNGTSAWWMSKGSGAMTKTEIENVLTGEISSHSHAVSSLLTEKGDLFTFGTVNARLPAGTDGQVLKSNSAAPLGIAWGNGDAAANGIPPGGIENQLLAKNSGTNYDSKWVDAPEAANGIPPGGAIGQILSKIDETDYNAQWIDIPSSTGTPSGDGTEYTYTGALSLSSGTYTAVAQKLEMLSDFWASKVRYYTPASAGTITLTIYNSGQDRLTVPVTIAASAAGWYEFALVTPFKLLDGYRYIFNFVTTTVYKYNFVASLQILTAWKAIKSILKGLDGTMYDETLGFGLIEYDDTP